MGKVHLSPPEKSISNSGIFSNFPHKQTTWLLLFAHWKADHILMKSTCVKMYIGESALLRIFLLQQNYILVCHRQKILSWLLFPMCLAQGPPLIRVAPAKLICYLIPPRFTALPEVKFSSMVSFIFSPLQIEVLVLRMEFYKQTALGSKKEHSGRKWSEDAVFIHENGLSFQSLWPSVSNRQDGVNSNSLDL